MALSTIAYRLRISIVRCPTMRIAVERGTPFGVKSPNPEVGTPCGRWPEVGEEHHSIT